MATKYYVVWQGHVPGIYTDWPTCKRQVDQFAGARYKSFATQAEAEAAFKGSKSATTKSCDVKSSKAASAKASGVKTYSAAEVDSRTETVKFFTDGGCEPNPGEAGSGLALYRNNQLAELWYGLYNPVGTNNTAELNALHQALLLAEAELNQGQSVAIFCDSQYSIQCITQWAVGWEKKGWKKSGGEIKNLELIQTMYALYQRLQNQLVILHVNGHVGVEGNELADRMSIYAMKTKQRVFLQFTATSDTASILAMRAG
ncbi:MAG: ribonuclease H family protein [Marinagarivorans sp.]|nr:ribonuclease H family protein [Marinagarivorans sp.]